MSAPRGTTGVLLAVTSGGVTARSSLISRGCSGGPTDFCGCSGFRCMRQDHVLAALRNQQGLDAMAAECSAYLKFLSRFKFAYGATLRRPAVRSPGRIPRRHPHRRLGARLARRRKSRGYGARAFHRGENRRGEGVRVSVTAVVLPYLPTNRLIDAATSLALSR
jgi:hypothetical protein